MLSLKTLAVTSALALQAAAVNIRIDVGKNGLVFSPNSTNAAIGDVLEFHFYARNHSVVQGRFDQPVRVSSCRYLAMLSTQGDFFS